MMNSIESPFKKISEDRRFIIDCYTEMLSRIGESEVVDLINSNLQGVKIEEQDLSTEKTIQSLSIYFQLMTLVEENAATQYRRRLEDQDKMIAIRGSWAEKVFSWNLSRITLTGWYGLGEALKTLKAEKPEDYQLLKEAVNHWNFFKFLMIQSETNLILSNLEMMKHYADLDQDPKERDLFMNKLLTDHKNGFELIEELFEEPASIRRNGQYDNLSWRNDKLLILHQLHIKYLKQWRSLDDDEKSEKDALLNKLLSLINALSSGLKNTG